MKTLATDNLPTMDATLQQLVYNGLDGMLTLEVDAAIPHTPTRTPPASPNRARTPPVIKAPKTPANGGQCSRLGVGCGLRI